MTVARLYRAFIVCCSVFFAGFILEAILRYGVDVPFWDQWQMVSALRRSGLGALLYRVEEHRVAVQMLTLLSPNMRVAMVLNWATAVAFCIMAAVVTRRALPAGGTIPWTVLGAAALFVFNPAAYQPWLWGLPLVHMLIPLLFLCGVAVVQSCWSESLKVAATALCALLASFALASGLLLWALFVPVLLTHTKPGIWRRARGAVVLAAALLVLSVVLVAPGAHTAHGGASLAVMAEFFLAYTGSITAQIAHPMPIRFAQAAGLALLAFFAALLVLGRNMDSRVRVIWGCMGCYSILAGAMTAVGRSGFGAGYALDASRYVLSSSFLPLACVALGSLLAAQAASRLPQRLGLYSWALSATVLLVAAGCGCRLLQTGRALALMCSQAGGQLAGKVALLACNLIHLPQYREIYPADDREEFKRCANYLNAAGRLSPRLWDESFLRRVAALPAAVTAEQRVAPGEAIMVLATGAVPRLVTVAFSPGDIRVTQPAPGSSLRAFAYNARTGEARPLEQTVIIVGNELERH